MTTLQQSTYDDVPYEGQAFAESHPERLGAIGVLHGMSVAPSDRCRVLELGCAEGSNLIPMAARSPESQFVGIDLSPRQIEAGRNVIAQLGLTNIDLQALDIRDIDETLGTFDYIIAHGVFSWVPADVREKLIAVCRQNLAPHGIAYVCYSTYPGGHVRAMVREMILYHTRNESNPLQRVCKGRDLIDFLIASSAEGSAYRASLEWERKHLEVPDHHVYHDTLETNNDPVYFADFMTLAERNGLQYLGDAQHSRSQLHHFDEATQNKIAEFAGNRIEREQYIDFIRNSALRQSLLVHESVQLNFDIEATCLPKFRVASPLKLDSPAPEALVDQSQVAFNTDAGRGLQVQNPFTKTALRVLEESWPESLPFDTLVDQTNQQLQRPTAGDDDKHQLAYALLECFNRDLVRFDLRPSTGTSRISERPRTNPLVRLQAAKCESVTSEFHRGIPVDAAKRLLLNQLDGTHTRDDLVELLTQAAQRGEIVIELEGTRLTHPDQLRNWLGPKIDGYLAEFKESGLLVA